MATTTPDPANAPSYRRTLTLTNACGMPASALLSATPPFVLLAVEPSVPQLPHSGPLQSRVFTLPPRETADVTVAFQLPPSEDPALQDYTLQGSLVFSFTSGVEQRFPLVARVEHPETCLSSSAVDFGRTHCGAPQVLTLELSNPTQARNRPWGGAAGCPPPPAAACSLGPPPAPLLLPQTLSKGRALMWRACGREAALQRRTAWRA